MASWSDAEILGVLWRHRVQGQTASQLALSVGATRSAICGMVFRVEAALSDQDLDRITDSAWLDILDAFEAEGCSADALAKEFAPHLPGLRVTRMAILHLVHLALVEAWQAGPCACAKVENRNGALPRRWWEAGVWIRGKAA